MPRADSRRLISRSARPASSSRRAPRGAPTELINLRLSARGITDKPALKGSEPGGEDPSAALKSHRDAYFDGDFQSVPVYDGLKLVNGNVVPGPAIIEQPTTTIVLPPGFTARCDEHDNYRVER